MEFILSRTTGEQGIVPRPKPTGAMKFNYKKNQAWTENLHVVMQIGLTMAGCIMFCFWIGHLIDNWLGTKGLFVTVGTILGIAGGANVVYRQIMDVFPESKPESRSADKITPTDPPTHQDDDRDRKPE